VDNVREGESMGQFRIDLTLLDRNGGPPRTVEALVDTGAAYSVVPAVVLESLGCRPVRTQRVVLADGRIEEWSVTQIDVECEGRSTTTPILMGPDSGPVLLGATTLEELGLGIDPLNRRLIPIDLYSPQPVWL
jgi:clan AA aspartic protease